MSTAQLLVRYSLQKGYTPVVKATSPEHLSDNIEAEAHAISEEDMRILDSWDRGVKGSLCMWFRIHSIFLLTAVVPWLTNSAEA